MYRLHNIKAPPELFRPDWHLELDEPEDYELIKKIYEHFVVIKPKFTAHDIVDFLENNPALLEINKDVQRVWEKVREEEIK